MVLSNVPSPMTEDSLDARVEDSGVFVFGFVDGDGEQQRHTEIWRVVSDQRPVL